MKRVALLALAACGSAQSPASEPPAAAAPPAALPPADAAVADAGPSPALAAATAWIFRFNAAPRVETWTLRLHEGEALLDVVTVDRTTRYTGTATGDATISLSVATATAKLSLECKRASRAIGATCKAKKPAAIDVLDCYHPDFAEPMTFAAAPGVEYAAECNGYRRLE